MTRTENERVRNNRVRSARRRHWNAVYRARIAARLERCRRCTSPGGVRNYLTFDHIVPIVLGGRSRLDNITILCVRCNTKKGDDLWLDLVSLAAEEEMCPPERRWSQMTVDEAVRDREPAEEAS